MGPPRPELPAAAKRATRSSDIAASALGGGDVYVKAVKPMFPTLQITALASEISLAMGRRVHSVAHLCRAMASFYDADGSLRFGLSRCIVDLGGTEATQRLLQWLYSLRRLVESH